MSTRYEFTREIIAARWDSLPSAFFKDEIYKIVVQESHRALVQFNQEFGISYFWKIDSSDQELGKYYSHHGGVPRSHCFIFIIPKHNLGAFIITNQSGKNTCSKMAEALNEIFEKIT